VDATPTVRPTGVWEDGRVATAEAGVMAQEAVTPM
jgi:hypothetical protein